ncbi:hypothetical protein B0T18DRAFT_417359 [Schizothecium vesticola]|uniref:C2H2-type domain-containing protein n=1 Tax=Schizothecium vesticola TaxID=314040 RepID=A0AA40EIY1_9PEZI|nr:hypothetical protein B0T18DRAFT_417359 [Schizothecium vesticola]
MRPATKRERDIKCVRFEPRKRVKSASPQARTGTGTGTDDTGKRSELLACPFYKHDPTEHMECLLRNRLTSTSFVRQHLQRAHRQPIHCSTCGHKFRKEVELDDHVREARCRHNSFTYPGLNMGQLMQIRKPPRDLDEQGRWNSMWEILFPGEPCPVDPYVGSAQEEILGIARRAVEAASPDTSLEVLQILNWDAVSTIYTRRSIDKTSPPSSQDSWPPTPESMDGGTPEATTKPLVRPSKSTKFYCQSPTMSPLENATDAYLGNVYDPSFDFFFLQSQDTNSTVGETQRTPGFSNPYSFDLSRPLPADHLCPQFTDPDPWLPLFSSTPSLSISCSSPGFSPLAETEVIDLTH